MTDQDSAPEPEPAPTKTDDKPAKKAKKKRPLWWRVLRVVLVILLVPIVLVAAALFYVSTDAGKERARAFVETRLNQRVNGSATLEGLDFELLGEVRLSGLTIKDADGNQVIALDHLRVAPSWGDLAGGEVIAIDDVAVKGVHLDIVKNEDGTSNLSTLFKKQPAKEGEADKTPSQRAIELRKISVEDVDVSITSADGTKLAVNDLAFAGSARGVPATRDLTVTLTPIALDFDLVKPEDKGGLQVGLADVTTGVRIDVQGGKGTAKLEPMTAGVHLLVPGKIDHSFPFTWDGIELAVTEEDIGINLEDLALGALSLASIEVRGGLSKGSLEGEQAVDVVGLTVDAAKLNELIGREVLATNVEVEAHVSGTTENPEVALSVDTAGGKVRAKAKLDITDKDHPQHDIDVELLDVDTAALLASVLQIPDVKASRVHVKAKGVGKDAASIKTDARIEATNVVVRSVTIDKAVVTAQVAGDMVTVEALDVDALDQHVSANGTFDRGSKTIDMSFAIDGDVGIALAKLKSAGVPISTELAPGLVKLPKGALTIDADGTVGGAMTLGIKGTQVALFGGRANVVATLGVSKGDPEKGEKSTKVDTFDFTFDVSGLLLSNLLALRNKRIPPELGFDAVLALNARGKGTPTAPVIDATVSALTLRADKGDRVEATAVARITHETANATLVVRDVARKDLKLIEARAYLPITLTAEKRGIDKSRWLDVAVELPKRKIEELTRYVPEALLVGKPIPKYGHLELGLHVTGTLERPKADAKLLAAASLLERGEPTPLQQVKLEATLEPKDARSAAYKLGADLEISLDEGKDDLLDGHIDASFASSPLAGGFESVRYEGKFAMGPGSLRTLPDTPKLASVRGLGGRIDGKLAFSGDARDLNLKLELDAIGVGNIEKFVDPLKVVPPGVVQSTLPPGDPRGIFDVQVRVNITPETTILFVDSQLKTEPLAKLEGTLGLPGKGFFQSLKNKIDPALDLTFTVPPRELKTFAQIRTFFEEAPGVLSGTFYAKGTVKKPLLVGSASVASVAMMDGTTGGAGVDVVLDEDGLALDLGLGAPNAKASPIRVAVAAPREELLGFSSGEFDLPLDVTIAAKGIDLRQVIPKDAVKKTDVEPKGALDWDMKVHVDLTKSGKKTVVKEASVDGSIDFKGNIPIPGTPRMYQDVDLAIRAAGTQVSLERLSLKESDKEVKDRSFFVNGTLVLDKLRPTKVDLTLKSHEWLLFGAAAIGRADAPRGTLTMEAKAYAELDRPLKLATIDVDKLEVKFPDRFDKAHQPEDVHAGDVVILGEAETELGKLPVPPAVKEAAEIAEAKATGQPVPPADPESGLDVEIRIAKGARLFQSPIDLKTGGEIKVQVRPEGRTIRGRLDMISGELSLGGKMHPLREGSLVFDEQNPKGFVDLWFEKPMPPWALRDVSEASAGTTMTIHTFGPLADRKSVLSGAGSPGALFDLLSMHNVGRERLFSEADLPESVAVEFPQHQGLLALSFISVNLPHLLFLDRVASWSDPYDDYRAYGRLEHYQAERYFADGKGRVRAGKRPETFAQSEAEVEVDYLFYNDARMLFGIGGVAGTRGGGGPSLVFEWSSKD